MRRPRPAVTLFLAVLVLAVATAALGFLAGRLVRSPAEALAETAAPSATVLTAPVTRQRVTRSVTFDAMVVQQHVTRVRSSASTGEGDAVVTRLPVHRGGNVRAGSLIAEISGRPVFALSGRLPSYRALVPGDKGPDVRQLQQALSAAGYRVAVDGTYGSMTSAAVSALYRARGYEPSEVGEEEVSNATADVHEAQRSLDEAERNKADRAALRDARSGLARAYAALAAARAEAGAQLPVGAVSFLPSLPARVGELNAAVGDRVQGDLMTLTSGPLVVEGAPVATDARQIRVGDHAQVLLTPGGDAAGRVVKRSVTPAGGEDGMEAADGAGVAATQFVIRTDTPLKRRSVNTPARVVVTVSATPMPVLTVPVSAIDSSADGSTWVTALRDGHRVAVAVTPGLTGDGRVSITPLGSLAEGDPVAVGASAEWPDG